MSCVIFGAGKIARGFVGHLLYLSNIEFTFVEKVDSLVDLINERKQYLKILIDESENNKIKVLTGLQGVGKSYLLEKIFQPYLIHYSRI